MLAQDPRLVLCHTRARVIGDNGEPLQCHPDQNQFIDSYGDFVMGPERENIAGSSEPEIRFREVLWWTTWCLPLFGVMRRAALVKTGLHRYYDGGDKVLLAEMALKGGFYQIRDKLFSKQVHRGCTYYINNREKAQHESEEPRGIPQFNMLRDYTRLILAADITTKQRLHCMLTVLGMTRRQGLWRKLLVPGPDNYLGLSLGVK